MEVTPVRRTRDKTGADREIAEPLARLPIRRISREYRIERGNKRVVIEVFRIELGQTRSVERRAEIEIVSPRPFSDQTDLGEIGPRAAVGAAGHADDNVVGGQAVTCEAVVERIEQGRQIAFAFRERETAGRQCDAGHRIAPQTRPWRQQTRGLGDAVHRVLMREGNIGDDQILVRGDAEIADAQLGDLPQRRHLILSDTTILNTAVLHVQGEMRPAVAALDPAVAIAHRGEHKRFRLPERDPRATRDFGAKIVQPAILDGVFEACMLAVGAVAPVALRGDDRFGHRDGLIRGAETEHVRGARIGVRLAMGHAHASAGHHVPARHIADVVDDSDKAEIVGIEVHVVRRRHRDGDLEFPRQIGAAIDRLDHFIGLRRAGDLLAVEPDLAIGAGARRQMIRDRLRQGLRRGMRPRLIRVRIAHHVAIDVAAGRDGVEQLCVDLLQGRAQVRFDHAMELNGLAGRQPHRSIGIGARDPVEREPLRRGQDTAGDPHPQHESKGFLQLLAAPLRPQIAVVLKIHPVKLHELLIVLDD